jgi:dihydrofolate reductase
MTEFTLTVVTSADGFIARAADDAPHQWASKEEQALFFQDIANADWCILGRNTHLLADRPDRRRIVFSRSGGNGVWQRQTQLWLDPAERRPADLKDLVAHKHALQKGLILGGTRVHDWFLDYHAIDRVHLTIEPIKFGAGLRLFSAHHGAADQVLDKLGFALVEDRLLNAAGTRYCIWERG